jgi:bifunctional non-homologous end joining protein LigD
MPTATRSKATGRKAKTGPPATRQRPATISAPPTSRRPAKTGTPTTRRRPAKAGAVAKSAMPATVSPMLATLVDTPPSQPGWSFEVKWDGYRAIARCDKQDVHLLSRNNKSFDDKFYPIREALAALKLGAVLDGEITVLKPDGSSSFGALQNWRSEADGELIYYVFDLLWIDDRNIMDRPLSERRTALAKVLPGKGPIRESPSFDTTPEEFLDAAKKMGLEGMIAKRLDSPYKPGDRGRDWLKIKVQQRQEVVIGGYTKNDDSPKPFSSLLIGVYNGKQLDYIGKVGTGFNEGLQKEMMQKFKSLKRKTSPFSTIPNVNEPSRFRPNPPHAEVFWLKPDLICEVSFAEFTSDGVLRHPSFEGLREDKSPKDVHAERAKPIAFVTPKPTASLAPKPTVSVAPEPATGAAAKSLKRSRAGTGQGLTLTPAAPLERRTLLNPTDQTQVRTISGHELKFNNLAKVFWPKEGYTKRDLLNYYYQTAPYILPYLKDRPQSLNRFPNGIEGKSFYQKDVTTTAPPWVKQFPYHTSTGEDKNFLVVEDEASLLWMANLGAIEMNPWNSTIQKPDNPTWCIIDLDPTEKNTFEQVIKTALITKQVLDELKITGYPKTSGSTGIHIYIPMGAKYTYEKCQAFGKLIATQVHQRLPRITSIERLTDRRKGCIYVDYLQNRPKATLAAPYSVRPKPGATVSMPLHWEEVKKGLKMKQFTLKNAVDRIKREGDIFNPVLQRSSVLKTLDL